jgi:hypothetical protein
MNGNAIGRPGKPKLADWDRRKRIANALDATEATPITGERDLRNLKLCDAQIKNEMHHNINPTAFHGAENPYTRVWEHP